MKKVEIDIKALMDGIKDMDATEVGAYMLLLFESYSQISPGYLVKEKEYLKKVCRVSNDQWNNNVIPKVFKKFKPTDDGNYIYNSRAIKEVEKVKKKEAKKATKGILTPEQKKLKDECYKIYLSFYHTRLPESEPNINAVQIKSLNGIMAYLKKTKNTNTDEDVIRLFRILFEFLGDVNIVPRPLRYIIKLSDVLFKIDNILLAFKEVSVSSSYQDRISQRTDLENDVNYMIETIYGKKEPGK